MNPLVITDIQTRRHFLGTLLAAAAGSPRRLHATSPNNLDALASTEKVMHDFVVNRMMDGDGLCRSCLCAATGAPWTNADLAKTDQRLITDMFQNSPDKAGCMSYENALMATGEFAVSQIVRHRVTNDAAARELAHRAIHAILAVIEEGRHYMPGWLPKPFGGLRNVRNSHEMSTDQYTKAIVALHAWRPLASKDEQMAIDRFFVDAADFFVARKFRHAYRHRTIVTADSHRHALGLFVPLVVLAAKTFSDAGYRKHLTAFSAAMDASLQDEGLANFNMTSLMVEGYHVAMQAGLDDPRLPQTIKTLWQRGAKRVDTNGDAYEDGRPPRKDSQGTRLAAIATIAELLDPATRATELASKILARQSDPRKMTHTRLPESIAEVAITSWLVAYWRLREWALRDAPKS
ncbi:MAG: hypothetical protein HZC54_08040 [Verrucomicrobia bacterium]|nr:hypothetical protein [Verrucomicrobiota bacterium]